MTNEKIHLLKNRLKRLQNKVNVAPPDRQGAMTSRIAEIIEILKTNK